MRKTLRGKTKRKIIKLKENQMKATKVTNGVLLAAVLVCLFAVGSGSAFAQEVLRNPHTQTFKNTCPGGNACSNWGESVSTDEPASGAEPVVVTWSARYFVNTADVYYVGLSVNGGACKTDSYGPTNLDDIATNPPGHFLTVTFQWIVLPGDGLEAGKTNTFELCGGGNGGVKGDEITIAQNTLTVAKY
jgi:hypothetical protein